jgi:outer membrane translocation and assembly module TamA
MLPRGFLPVAPLVLACLPSAFGQLPKRLEKCLPYPTLAQEIREMQPEPTRLRVHVIRVEFDSNDGVPADAQEEISTALRSRVIEPDADTAYLKDLASEIAEVGVRGALRNRGYFKATATASLTRLQTQGADVSVVATIRATLGLQYRMGNLRIESADSGEPFAISPEVLRGLIPLQTGELFDVEKIRTGMQNLAHAYGREGYVDMTPEPETQVDNERGTIDLTLKIDQQVQYRVGNIELLGVSDVTRQRLLESLPKPGDVFDSTKLNEFFKVNRVVLPPDVSRDDISVERDVKMRTVRVLFDLRVCSPQSN